MGGELGKPANRSLNSSCELDSSESIEIYDSDDERVTSTRIKPPKTKKNSAETITKPPDTSDVTKEKIADLNLDPAAKCGKQLCSESSTEAEDIEAPELDMTIDLPPTQMSEDPPETLEQLRSQPQIDTEDIEMIDLPSTPDKEVPLVSAKMSEDPLSLEEQAVRPPSAKKPKKLPLAQAKKPKRKPRELPNTEIEAYLKRLHEGYKELADREDTGNVEYGRRLEKIWMKALEFDTNDEKLIKFYTTDLKEFDKSVTAKIYKSKEPITVEFLHQMLQEYNEKYNYKLSEREMTELARKSALEVIRVKRKIRQKNTAKKHAFICPDEDPAKTDPELLRKLKENDKLGGKQKLSKMLGQLRPKFVADIHNQESGESSTESEDDSSMETDDQA